MVRDARSVKAQRCKECTRVSVVRSVQVSVRGCHWECMLHQGGLGVHAISWRTGSACYIMGDLECRDRSAAMI